MRGDVVAWGLAVIVVLVACSGSSEPPAPKPTKGEWAARAEAAAQAQPARHRSIPVGSSELVVVDVPVALSPKLVGSQPCFIWRDAEFKTATMSCPGDATPSLASDTVEPPQH